MDRRVEVTRRVFDVLAIPGIKWLPLLHKVPVVYIIKTKTTFEELPYDCEACQAEGAEKRRVKEWDYQVQFMDRTLPK